MNSTSERYDRNIRLFGAEGQDRLRGTTLTIVGIGGLGSPLAQHLALLGVGKIYEVEPEELDNTNRNRFVGARHDDPVPGSLKVALSARMVSEINPDVQVVAIDDGLVSERAFEAILDSDWVFGCFDDDGPRSILNELCAAYSIPYVDLASDVPQPGAYGGRVCISRNGEGCLSCMGLLDPRDVRRFFCTEADREMEDATYGVDRAVLDEKGPSVSPINGVVASLAAVEFMVAATGMREPTRHLEYRGHDSRVVFVKDVPAEDCYICKSIYGRGAAADVERYLAMPQLRSKPPVSEPRAA